MKRTLLSLSILLGAGLAFNAQAAGNAEAGKAKAASCTSCHGVDGKAPNALWPNLAGQNAAYLEKQLKDFRAEQRKDPLMSPMARSLSDEDIADLAAFFNSL